MKKSATKSDLPPRGRTMTRSSSRDASPQAAVYALSDANKVKLLLLLLTISHFTQNIPTMSEHQVFSAETAICPLISLRHVLLVLVSEAKVSNTTMAVGMLAALGAAS